MHEGATVTVGFDGSRCARRAVDWAAAEVASAGGRVRVVASFLPPVAAEPWYVPAPVDVTAVRESAARLVAEVVTSCRQTYPSVTFEEIVTLGAASDELVAAAGGSDLLVVGTHGHGPLDAWRLGSVAHAVARRADCPVVVVPDVEPRPRRDRVVVGVDGSAASTAALRWAGDEADDRDAELVVVHCWSYAYATELGSPTARDLTAVDAALTLEAAVRTAREHRCGPVVDRLVEGRPGFTLAEESHDADLVVVGSRGRGAVRSLLFGSVSQEVSSRATCPTVIVREDDD